MTTTYDCIATTTLGSNAGTVDITSIPATYTDLILVFRGNVTIDSGLAIRLNGDTASNYSFTELVASSNSGVASRRTSNNNLIGLTELVNDNLSTAQIVVYVQLFNYANTTTFKTIMSRYNDASTTNQVGANVGLWRKTPEAINSIRILANMYNGSNQIAAGSNFSLYGIKAE